MWYNFCAVPLGPTDQQSWNQMKRVLPGREKTTACAVRHIQGEMRWCPWSYLSPVRAARGTNSLSCGILRAFSFHEHWIFPWHSLSCVTMDSVFVWVCYWAVASFTMVFPRQRGLNILGPVFPIQVLEQLPQSRGKVLVLGIQRVSQSFNFCNNSCYGVSWFNQELWKKMT